MNSPKSSASQYTERGCFSSHVFLWTVAGVSILLLSACFIIRCVVTYRIFQLCGEINFQPHEDITELSCYNDGSGSVKDCCPLDWVHFQSSCYFFSTNTMTWTASLKNCSNMGAHLVVINTQEEQEFLFRAKPRKREFYIGLTDQVVEKQWEWLDGTPLIQSLSFWDIGEPNNIATVEDCATIRDSSNPRQNWNDVPCFFNMFWICEMPEKNLLNKEKSLREGTT
ncbi:C-type lectin domain family 4 member E [Rousettus aegyptiacus]|uniref:C-type lectin domain family 4 member E n=1 Tax=Rousettus aegyptiacus TaxID=9407 RepID=A0A7J8JD70_ROUAE|nr:C-type lectin domain family 4 member E [Rousettus aegyptiacus]KAF6494275.1 C-type lectin domain family 4 member E [Rousettus aegyptiacus]